MVRVKICGITRAQDARLAEKLGAYAIGLNFHEKSSRVISPADAWKIRKRLDPATEAVGVFVDWKARLVVALAHSLELSAIQLHGDECSAYVTYCNKFLPVIKALRIDSKFSPARLGKYRKASAFLLDASQPGQFGGTGKTADWSMAQKTVEARGAVRPILLAGGLTPENVGEAILTVRPYAVDVASGVESRPGIKDAGKLREFFAEVARANKALSHNS
ncbi:MAG: phosphoribosylanthranilate isomerase [Acidobacteria bacterium]|nr:phosphoribosylanthranilate isomerase [Acidobacteriota bacterium]MBS1865677.1 phosphoribosylanthranilate isomerase [Acidobacteriota bacterium]